MTIIKRAITTELKKLLKEYPVVTILGPRQSGKTTLVKNFLKNFSYANLEDPEVREFATYDPKSFLKQLKRPVILDEIQRVPSLLSYIQVIVDANQSMGEFILTGSHQLKLQEVIAQSLAGRTGILNLLPLSITELKKAKIELGDFTEYAYKGFYPRIYKYNQRPSVAYSNYFQTYIEKDVRQLINIKNLNTFEKFIKLLAGRVAKLMDYSSLAGDVGVDTKTIKEWLSILEASFIVFKLPPFYQNFGKRMMKSPKYYFCDTGLLCYLLGIQNPKQILRDPLMGNIFENLMVIEVLKNRYNQGLSSNLYFYRDSNQVEIDLLLDFSRRFVLVEIKASSTFHRSLLHNFNLVEKSLPDIIQKILLYNGESKNLEPGSKIRNFMNLNFLNVNHL
jgi:predicted AAA+ superfamily ATPase